MPPPPCPRTLAASTIPPRWRTLAASPVLPRPLLPHPCQVMAHICSAIDYKDNDKLLEEYVTSSNLLVPHPCHRADVVSGTSTT